jgi:hypothetical protein
MYGLFYFLIVPRFLNVIVTQSLCGETGDNHGKISNYSFWPEEDSGAPKYKTILIIA